MSLYDLFMAPLETWLLKDLRAKVITCAKGNVLEVGIGTGANAKFYDSKRVTRLIGLDRELTSNIKYLHAIKEFSFIVGSIEQLPFDDSQFDCVVATLVLCTTDLHQSIQEIKRVLKPRGVFVFIEHVRPSGRLLGYLFDFINKIWPKIANGCNLNHKTDLVLHASGFSAIEVNRKWCNIFSYGIAQK